MSTCKICGKPLTDSESIAREMGPICAANAENGEALARVEAALREEVPEGYIPLGKALQMCSDLGIPHGRLVVAMGKDRLVNQPVSPEFWPVYVGKRRMRYLPEAVLASIPELLETGSDAPRKKRTKKAKKVKPSTKAVEELLVINEQPAKVVNGGKQYEVVAANYGMEVGTITTLKELKAAFRKEHGVALKMVRKRTKNAGTQYLDAVNDQVVAQAID